MANVMMILLQRRIRYLEGENQYLKGLLERWYEIFSSAITKEAEEECIRCMS